MLSTAVVNKTARYSDYHNCVTLLESATKFYFFLERLHEKQVLLFRFERKPAAGTAAAVFDELNVAFNNPGQGGNGNDEGYVSC